MVLQVDRVLLLLILSDSLLCLFRSSEIVYSFLFDILVHIEEVGDEDPALHFLSEELLVLVNQQVSQHANAILLHVISQLVGLLSLSHTLLFVSLDFIPKFTYLD